jgi:hypothetical protein
MSRWSVPLSAFFVACGGDPPPEVPLAEVCGEPTVSGKVAWGDANRDGAIDVSDSVYTQRWIMNGGPDPACEAAQDLLDLGDGQLDMSDGIGILYHLFVGTFDLPAGSPACDDPNKLDDAPCGQLGAMVSAPAKVKDGADFTADLLLRSPDLELEAWSVGVRAEGCTITAASTDGTAIADVRLDPEGHRDMGFSRIDVVPEGVTQGAVLSWERKVHLPKRDEPYKAMTLTVSAAPPETGCGTCTLSLTSDLKGGGKKVAAVATASGRSYVLPASMTTVEVCR